MIDMDRITACGECCDACEKKRSGVCPGCIEADGRVPEWADSGVCRVHACARAHGARFCGLCAEFPCARLGEMIFWKPDAAARLSALRDACALELLRLPAFSAIGIEGSTDEGADMVAACWRRANARFGEIAPLAKKGPEGAPVRVWGLMSDPSRSLKPWADGFTRGLYLAGAECRDDAEPPAGWTKWTVPAAEYARFPVDGDAQEAFRRGLAALGAAELAMAGAAFDCTVPAEGRSYVFFPVRWNP